MRVARVLGPAEYQRLRGGVQSGWKLSPEAQERVARPDASFLTPPWLPDGGAGWGVGSEVPSAPPPKSGASSPHPGRPCCLVGVLEGVCPATPPSAGLWATSGRLRLHTSGHSWESGISGLGLWSWAPRGPARLQETRSPQLLRDTDKGAAAPEVAGGGRACGIRGRFPPPGSRPDCAAPARGADTREAASGATGAAGGASLAPCGPRRNSLCPFLAAAATRCPLHVDEAAPGSPSSPARGLAACERPRLGSDGRGGGGGGRGPVLGCALGLGVRAPWCRSSSAEKGLSKLRGAPGVGSGMDTGWTCWRGQAGEATRSSFTLHGPVGVAFLAPCASRPRDAFFGRLP